MKTNLLNLTDDQIKFLLDCVDIAMDQHVLEITKDNAQLVQQLTSLSE